MILIKLFLFAFVFANNKVYCIDTDSPVFNDEETIINSTYLIAIGLCQNKFNNSNISELDLFLDIDLNLFNISSNSQVNVSELALNCMNECCELNTDNCDVFIYDYNKTVCNQFSCKNDCLMDDESVFLSARIKRSLVDRRKRNDFVDYNNLIFDTMSKLNATEIVNTTTSTNKRKKRSTTTLYPTSTSTDSSTTSTSSTSSSSTSELKTSITTSTTIKEVTTTLQPPIVVEPMVFNEYDKFIQENTSILNDITSGLQNVFFFDSSKENHSFFEGFYYIFLILSSIVGVILTLVALLLTIRFCLREKRRRSYNPLGIDN